MNLQNKYMLFAAMVLMLTPVVLSTLSSDKIMNTDWVYRHTAWIDYYLRGDFRPAIEYPPLFDLMMAPFVAISFPMKYFQIFFLLLTIAGLYLYLRNHENERMMLLTFFMLATSITFVEYASALMPQGLDYLLFFGMLIFYYRNDYKYVFLLSFIMALMHNVALLFMGTIAAHSFIEKNVHWKKYAAFAALVILPIFIFYFFTGMWHQVLLEFRWDWNAQAAWDSQFLQPTTFFIYSGFLIWILAPFAVYELWKKKFKLSESQLMYALLAFSFVALWIGNFGVWRMISYQILPIALFVASLISDKK